MRSVEVEGNSRVDATKRALELLGADIDDVRVEVVKEEKRGFWGWLGFKRVTVRVTLLEENLMDVAAEVVNKILSFLPVVAEARVAVAGSVVQVVITSRELREFSREEDVADALAHILELILNRRAHRKITVKATFAEEKYSREEELRALARAAADRVAATGQPEGLAPMPARDRRTVHMALERDERVTTESAGEGPERHVVVYPARPHPPARTAAERRPAEKRARPPQRKPSTPAKMAGRQSSGKPPRRRTRPKRNPRKPGGSPPPEPAS